MKKPDYGFDAPTVVWACFAITIVLLISTIPIFYFIGSRFPLISWFVIALLILSACSVLYPAIAITIGSRVLKFRERDWLLSLLPIKDNQQILDVGCGRGLLLMAVAKKLKTGKAIGIDIWSSDDQTQNSLSSTLENARLEGVLDKVEVMTADARAMPFETNVFDLVISSWALHNISDQGGREKALSEIMRVLKPGGIVAIMDINNFLQYETFFKGNNFDAIELIGPRYTFGNATYIAKATKPKQVIK